MMLCANDVVSTEPCKARLNMIDTMIHPMAVVDDGRCEDHLADDTAHEIHLAHDHRDDLHRCDREGRSEKQRGDQPLLRVRQHAVGQHLTKRDAAGKRNDDAHQRGKQGSAPGLPHQLEVCLHSGEQEQKQDTELRDRVDHRFLLGARWKQRVLSLRKQQAKKRWPEQQPCDQLAHHGGLAQPQHGLAEQPADHHQDDNLGNENCFGCTLAAFGGPGRPCH